MERSSINKNLISRLLSLMSVAAFSVSCLPSINDEEVESISISSVEQVSNGPYEQIKITGSCPGNTEFFQAKYDAENEAMVSSLSSYSPGSFYGECTNGTYELRFNVPNPSVSRMIKIYVRANLILKGRTTFLEYDFPYETNAICAGATSYNEYGSGSLADPWKICTADQLKSIADTPSSWADAFELLSNIDMAAYYFVGGSQFQIGDCGTGTCIDGDGAEQSFTGSFDGGEFTIANYELNLGSKSGAGFFAKLEGSVLDLNLATVSISGADDVGALAGHAVAGASITGTGLYSGTVSGTNNVGGLVGDYRSANALSDIISTINVTGTGDMVGGFIGRSISPVLTISNINVSANVIGNATTGGIAGLTRATVDNCHFIGNVSSAGNYVGGIVGMQQTRNTSNSTSNGVVTGVDYVGGLIGYTLRDVSTSFSYANVNGNDYIGGLVGYASRFVSQSYTTGATVSSGGNYAGGLVGFLGQFGEIRDSFSTNVVAGTTMAGGVVGYTDQYSHIYRSYSSGSVSATGICGGLIGYTSSSGVTINHSFTVSNVSCTTSGKLLSNAPDTVTYSYTSNTSGCSGSCATYETGTVAPSVFFNPSNLPFTEPGPTQVWDTAVWYFGGSSFPTL